MKRNKSLIQLTVLLLVIIAIKPEYSLFSKKGRNLRSIQVSTDTSTIFASAYLTEKIRIKHNSNKIYYWFKNNQINYSQGNHSGYLLSGDFTSFSKNNLMTCKGEFKYGLKNNLWQYWDKNRMLILSQSYKDGDLNGDELIFKKGEVSRLKKYKDGVLHGKSYYFENDTIVIVEVYKKGILVSQLRQNKNDKHKFFQIKKEK
jgi:antitoxin component YwqK of YwqJK toxin-antitoxin module